MTAKPAGYAIAVPDLVFFTPTATRFPWAIFCGLIFMKRSGETLPSRKALADHCFTVVRRGVTLANARLAYKTYAIYCRLVSSIALYAR